MRKFVEIFYSHNLNEIKVEFPLYINEISHQWFRQWLFFTAICHMIFQDRKNVLSLIWLWPTQINHQKRNSHWWKRRSPPPIQHPNILKFLAVSTQKRVIVDHRKPLISGPQINIYLIRKWLKINNDIMGTWSTFP